LNDESLIEARELRKSYAREFALARNGGGPRFTAVDGVSFSVAAGETFAIVGERMREDHIGANAVEAD